MEKLLPLKKEEREITKERKKEGKKEKMQRNKRGNFEKKGCESYSR